MKTLVGLAVVALVGFESFGHAQEPNATEWVLIAPNEDRTVTVSRAGVVFVSLVVPKGAILMVSHQRQAVVLPSGDGRFEFLGNVDIRAQAVSQRKPDITLEQAMMEFSPVLLSGKDVQVVIVPGSQAR
jgi:hypothetical protein